MIINTMLTLRSPLSMTNFHRGDHVYMYEVGGLPPGERALISETPTKGTWEILRINNDVHHGDWAGRYESAWNALAALQASR